MFFRWYFSKFNDENTKMIQESQGSQLKITSTVFMLILIDICLTKNNRSDLIINVKPEFTKKRRVSVVQFFSAQIKYWNFLAFSRYFFDDIFLFFTIIYNIYFCFCFTFLTTLLTGNLYLYQSCTELIANCSRSYK